MKNLKHRCSLLVMLLVSALTAWSQHIIDVPAPEPGADATHLLQKTIDEATPHTKNKTQCGSLSTLSFS